MKAARREALRSLFNAAAAGFFIVKFAGDNMAGAVDALSALNLFLVGAGCFCLVGSASDGRNLLHRLASMHLNLAASRVFTIAAVAFVGGSILGGAWAWLRAAGFRPSAHFENPAIGKVLYFVFVIAATLLIASALRPFLFNRRALR